MATDQQVALTRSQKVHSTSSHISKAARQVVPAFLQKLYEMVNDPKNAELIRWSETGDSFFVLDHERFAHEVLGRWFKHRNFSSFVRQLNMYGFHKIPHLQQGVLKSDTDTEFWNFAHANFHRGQPDLLCLIQRKKQVAQQGDESTIELRDGANGVGLIGGPNTTPASTAASTATLSNGQVLDIHAIVSGINAIKRHQTTISADLNELKHSNQLLWQDNLALRTKHQKQEDTINRIVKFLAGVFGSHPATAGAGVSVPNGTPSVGGQENQDRVDDATSRSRRRMRLMIEDAKRDGPTKTMVEELTEIPTEPDTVMQYDPPISVPSPTPAVDISSFYLDSNGDSIVSPPQGKTVSAGTPEQQHEQQEKQVSRAVTPNRSPTSIEFDPRIHNILNQLTPSQTQILLASLAPHTITDPPPSGPAETINPSATSSLTQYHPHFDFSQTNPALNQLPTVDGLISFDNYESPPADATHSVAPSEQHEHEQIMENHLRAAEEIGKDVSALETSINSLIHSFTLDPALLEELDQNHGEMNGTTGVDTSLPIIASDFDFESLFNITPDDLSIPLPSSSSIPGTGSVGMDYGGIGISSGMGDITSAALLDEVHTPTASSDMTASPLLQPMRQVSPEITMTGTSDADSSLVSMNGSGASPFNANTTGKGAGGKKRKSETVVDFNPSTVLSDTTKDNPGVKVKRRKDK